MGFPYDHSTTTAKLMALKAAFTNHDIIQFIKESGREAVLSLVS